MVMSLCRCNRRNTYIIELHFLWSLFVWPLYVAQLTPTGFVLGDSYAGLIYHLVIYCLVPVWTQ